MTFVIRNPKNHTIRRNTNMNPDRMDRREIKKITRPLANVCKIEKGFIIELAIPGFGKEDLQIQWDEKGQLLKVSGEVKNKLTGKKNSKTEVSIERTFVLNSDLDPDGIQAKTENGILTIEIPNRTNLIKGIKVK